MKLSPLHWMLASTALILLGANLVIGHANKTPALTRIAFTTAIQEPGKGMPAKPSFDKPNNPGTAENATVEQPEAVTAPATITNREPATVDWASVESSDYKQYVRNLRAMGFPEDLVRKIAIADVDKLFEPREKPLKPRLVAYDAPMAQRQTHDISSEVWQRIKDLWQLRVEKQGVLQEILGDYVPRDILRTPISRNYEAYEYAINQLPPEKRNAVQLAQETEILTEGMNKTSMQDHAAELASFKRTREERDAAMMRVLTPEEFETYEMNTTPAGTELARRVIGMDPTEDEFRTMFRIAYTNWIDTGGVYGRWRAISVLRDQIIQADKLMDESMRQSLGPDRYLDYQLAISGTGQQLRNFAARFDLPRDVIEQVFDLQAQMDKLARTRKPAADGTATLSGDSSAQQIAQLGSRLQSVLGQSLWSTWEEGRNLKFKLDP
jgi:hypothetical protein